MDKRSTTTTAQKPAPHDWSWLPRHMPAVAGLIDVKRREVGREWVAECWRKGVIEGLPGWFFAAEGPLAVGVPPHEDFLREWVALSKRHPGATLLFLAPRPAAEMPA